jgi:putative hemolysin
MTGIGTVIIILVGCILAEGFFSGSEIALVNADKYRLALMTEEGSKRARAALRLLEQPSLFFSTTLVGTNMFVVAGSVVITLFIIHQFGERYAPFAILYSPLPLVFGEIVPKSIYQHYANRVVLKIAPILLGISLVARPVVWPLSKLTDFILGSRTKKQDLPPISREDLETMMDLEASVSSDVRPMERTMIARIFDLAEKKVENIMTPLLDVDAIPLTATREEAARVLEETEYSRLPVYDGRIHNIIGVLENTDLMFASEDAEVRNIVHPAYFVPEEMPLDSLLVAMKRKGEPMAIVVDEYGASTGVVTTEDLLEEVVGEIEDEHDEIRPLYKRLGPKRFLVDGRLEIEDANERLKLGIEDGDYETVAGYVIHHFERIPHKGEKITIGKFAYTILRASDRAVYEMEIMAKE